MKKTFGFALALSLMAGMLAGAPTHAAYPERPIKLVVSFPPGSGTDTNARYAATRLQERIGVPVIVENKPGANSFIAAEAVLTSSPA